MGIILFKFAFCRRPRPDQTHIAFYDIVKLRKLINACLTNKFPDLRNTRVVLHLEHQPLHLILLLQFLLSRFRVDIHGTEFINFKPPAIFPNSRLCKKDRPRRIQFYRQRDKRHHDSRKQQAHQSTHNIEQTL